MTPSTLPRVKSVLVTTLLSGLLLGSCSSAPRKFSTTASSIQAPAAGDAASLPSQTAEASLSSDSQGNPDGNAAVPRSLPQLIKTAALTVEVDDIEASLTAIRAIARQHRGDVIGLEDQVPPGERATHTAYLQLRVPQQNLDTTLDALAQLGTVKRRSLSATDVSNQLVDFEARLRNLRRTEEMLLDIMKRSGSVADVLKVAQEVSNVRNTIEQIDAQLSDLQAQVAYSTIDLNLAGAIATTVPAESIVPQLSETWAGATRSLQHVTVSLLQLGIWLLVYSPYGLVLGLGIVAGMKWRQRRSSADSPQ